VSQTDKPAKKLPENPQQPKPAAKPQQGARPRRNNHQNRQQNTPANGNGHQQGGQNQTHTQKRAVQQNTVLAKTQTRRGEVQRAMRRNNETVTQIASKPVIAIPVNKSGFNGYHGSQYTLNSARKANRLPLANEPTVKVIPIGGLGEMGIGKNMMAIEYDNDIIIIDMGLLFPGPDYPGVNYIVPDIGYLEERKHKIRGIVFTHAHLDHIGAVKHLLHKIPAPVYASKFTVGMLEKAMSESTSGYNPQYNVMDPDVHERVQLGDSFSVELVRVNHSIPDPTAVVVRTPVGVLVNTGDWRFEENPVDGKPFDKDRLQEIADTAADLGNVKTQAEADVLRARLEGLKAALANVQAQRDEKMQRLLVQQAINVSQKEKEDMLKETREAQNSADQIKALGKIATGGSSFR
jgi:hypothetical protein